VTEFDLIIRGGTVIDGTGKIGRRADVGVLGDRILPIGDRRAVEDAAVAELTGVSAARS
jgi:N-acyl-D-aspartate/D-glutamate deacylase